MATKKEKSVDNDLAQRSERFIKECMRGLEIGLCYCSDTFEEDGEGIVVVSRRLKGDKISFCAFLVDTYCLGLRKAFWEVRASEMVLDNLLRYASDLRQCDYNEAHSWVYGAIAWAEDAGFAPCKEWGVAQYFLEEDTVDVPLMDLPFGQDGIHFLVANSQAELDRYLPTLRKNLGDDFDYTLWEDEDDYDADDTSEDYDDFPFMLWLGGRI